MTKLKCEDHGRRVMVLDSGKTLHRNDGSKCESKIITIDGTIMEALDVCIHSTLNMLRF